MTRTLIREACPSDYEAVDRIANEAFYEMVEELPHLFRKVPHSIPREEFDAMLTDPEVFILVAVEGTGDLAENSSEEQTVGFITAAMKRSSGHECVVPRTYAYVSYFGMKAEWQRRGIGRALMERCTGEVARRGGSFLELKVWDFNGKAIRFYEKFGMRTLNRTMELPLR